MTDAVPQGAEEAALAALAAEPMRQPVQQKPTLRGCHACGQVQQVPSGAQHAQRFGCVRCGHRLLGGLGAPRHRTAALALTGLVIYPLAVTVPVMSITHMGQVYSTGVLDGAITLLAEGELLVGLAVLLASVVLPLIKLMLLLVLDLMPTRLRPKHRGFAWLLVEVTGRWGMLDVLLVAVLVAAMKLGDLVAVEAGPGAGLFTALVVISLLAASLFDPHALWERGASTANSLTAPSAVTSAGPAATVADPLHTKESM